jgi:drug/metabolite transporter (DMT)-like permease
MNRTANYLAGIGYAVIFGFSFLFTKSALGNLAPFELLFCRFSLASASMAILLALRLVKSGLRTKIASRRGLRDLAITCLCQPLLYFTAETFGVRESSSSVAGVVIGAIPAGVAVISVWMLKERLSLRQAISLAASIFGVALIALASGGSAQGSGSVKGFLFLLGAVASATLYNIFSRKTSRWFTPFETTFAMMLTGTFVFGIAALAGGAASGTLAGLPERALASWQGIAYLGLLSSVVAFFLMNFTLSRMPASQSVVFTSLASVVAMAAGVLIRGESFGLLQAFGSAAIILGVWGTNMLPRKADA